MNENFEDAFALKLQHFPCSFFKYRCLTPQTLDIIQNNELWLAEISKLNDPFECSLQFDHDKCLRHFYGSPRFHQSFNALEEQKLTAEEIKRLTAGIEPYAEYLSICKVRGIHIAVSKEQFESKIQKRFTEIIEESNNNIKITCFSESNSSLLMWSHYADKHKGICIEWDFLDDDTLRPFLNPIIYHDQVYKLELLEDLNMLKKVGSSLIKSKEWEYEAEWRLISMKQSQNDFSSKIKVPVPNAVYLGTRYHENPVTEIDKLATLLASRNIPAFQMIKHINEFKLVRQV
jgi:hypothetical protein